MGTFRVPIEIGNVEGTRFETVDALVDTGASYSRAPRALLKRLGVHPQERWPFRIADGSVVDYEVGQGLVRLAGRSRFTVLVFGDEGQEPLLGAVTLEEFGLSVDPLHRRLVPVPALLMQIGQAFQGPGLARA